MLASFTIRRTFNLLRVSMYVDCEAKSAEMVVTYDRRIKRIAPLRIWEVDTPEKAEQWLSKPMGERGNLIELLEWQCRSGLLEPVAA